MVVNEGGRPNAWHNRSKCPSLYQFPSSASLTEGCTFKHSKGGVSPLSSSIRGLAFFENARKQQRRLQRYALRSYRHVQLCICIHCDSGMQRIHGRRVIRTVVSNAGFNFRRSPGLHSRYSLRVVTQENNPSNGLDHASPFPSNVRTELRKNYPRLGKSKGDVELDDLLQLDTKEIWDEFVSPLCLSIAKAPKQLLSEKVIEAIRKLNGTCAI